MSIMFNEICINEEMLPKYIFLKSYLIYLYKLHLLWFFFIMAFV